MSEFVCETCGKEYQSRSGLWKHQKKAGHGKFAVEPQEFSSSGEDEPTIGTPNPTDEQPPSSDSSPEDTTFEWADFDFGTNEATDVLPTPLKSIVKPMPGGTGKLTKVQAKALEDQNKGILKMMLTTVDSLLTAYGKGVCVDESFQVKHSESDKELVANAQYRYMEEKGLFLTNYLSSGMIAGSLTVWYVGTPLMRIRRNAKKKLIRGRLLSRLPLIGRLFKRKKETSDLGQVVIEHES